MGQRHLLALAAAAVVVRAVVVLGSLGSNDAVTWQTFADTILVSGLNATYEQLPGFNHPPLAGWYAVGAGIVAKALDWRFSIVFKAAPFLADLVVAWLLYGLVRSRGPRAAAWVAVAYLWSPIAILVTCYHGNTDSILAALLLIAALLADRQRPVAAGLALAAALNVKLSALFLAPAILLYPGTWRDRMRGGFAFSLGLVPFVPVLLAVAPAFYRNAIAYNSNRAMWGIELILQGLELIPRGIDLLLQPAGHTEPIRAAVYHGLTDAYWHQGRKVVIAAGLAVGVGSAGGRRTAVQAAAASMAAFLFFTPGFGVQYCIWPLPLLFAADARAARRYSALAGTFLLLTYVHFWTGTMPALSWFRSYFPAQALPFGVWSWLHLGAFALSYARGLGDRPQEPVATLQSELLS